MEVEPIDKIPAPVKSTESATALHLSYIRRDVDQQRIDNNRAFEKLDRSISEINSKLDTMQLGFVTRSEFADHIKIDDDHENRIRVIEKAAEEALQRTSIFPTLVTKEEFAPVKKVVYGEVAIILTLVITAVVYLVINK